MIKCGNSNGSGNRITAIQKRYKDKNHPAKSTNRALYCVHFVKGKMDYSMKHLNGRNPDGINLSMFCVNKVVCVCSVCMFSSASWIGYKYIGAEEGKTGQDDDEAGEEQGDGKKRKCSKLKIYYSNNENRNT